MKVMFWSLNPGQCATTSNLLAVALMTALRKESVATMQVRFQTTDLVSMVMKQQQEEYQEAGLDVLLRMIKSEHVTKEIVHNCMVIPKHIQLSMLRATTQTNQEMYDKSVYSVLRYCMNAVDLYYDFVLIDGGFGITKESQKLLEEADLVVVNINQNPRLIKESMNFTFLHEHKVFYMIGMYDDRSEYSLKYIRKKFGIGERQIGVVPYSVQFRDACINGTVEQLFLRWSELLKEEEGYYFMSNIRQTTDKLIGQIREERRKNI